MQDKVSVLKSRDLSISLFRSANTLHATIVGSISHENSELLKQVFDRIANMQSEKVILNLQATSKISPSGIAKFLVLTNRLRSQARELVIEDLHNDLITIFKSISLDKFLKLEKDRSHKHRPT